MKLSEKVTSLKLSKKLKELGVKQESLFYWIENIESVTKRAKRAKRDCSVSLYYGYIKVIEAQYSAFSVAELGELLPKGIWLNVFFHSLEVQVQDKDSKKIFTDKTEVNARAKLLIHLIENNLLKL